MTLPKLRTINGAWDELKKIDPHTAISASAIRKLVKTGRLPSIRSGNRVYINMDTLLDLLNHPENYPLPERDPVLVQGIHRVDL